MGPALPVCGTELRRAAAPSELLLHRPVALHVYLRLRGLGDAEDRRVAPLVESRQPVLLEPRDSLGPADRVWDDRLVLEVALRRRDVEPG